MKKGLKKELEDVTAIYPDEMAEEEAIEYVRRGKKKYGLHLKGMEIRLSADKQDVDLYYDIPPHRFQRIRRVTGYLVGTLDRWNDAKRAEERDRVKHGE